MRALGLAWVREGLGPAVRARGSIGGQPVEARWRRGVVRDRVRVRRGGAPWEVVCSDEELKDLIAGPGGASGP